MSAIAGIFSLDRQPLNPEQIDKIMQALHKYPANKSQIWVKDCVFLGCHAQWITPESINEPLPFFDYERQAVITADAIIDNRNELFESLQIPREERSSIPDSQLILKAFYKWGEDCPKYLIGDFAFMIWDEKEKRLFGARDFSGSRTLYFHRSQRSFAFCTVMHPLFTLPHIEKKLNEQWLAEFLAISSVIEAVDTSITPYKEIEQLPPSHCISVRDGILKMTRFSTIHPEEPLKLKSNGEYEEAFRDVFQRAIDSRIRTYRSVGSHLSGGLDSGTVVSFAANSLKRQEKQLHTFSYVPPSEFKDFTPKYLLANEKNYIESTVNYIGGIRDHYVDYKDKNFLTEVDEILDIMETPYKFFENSIWIKGIFESASKEDIGILLNGGRGNLTISWGPALEYYAQLLKRGKWITLSRELDQYSNNLNVKRSKAFPYVMRLAFPTLKNFSSMPKYQSKRLINPDFANKTEVYTKLEQHGIFEMKSKLPNLFNERKRHFSELFHWTATNTIGTKLSLRYGLWKRDPTNDLRVIRFCLSVPDSQCVQAGLDRALIRRSTKGLLPDDVRLNQKFRGVQGVDWVYRLEPSWNQFIDEVNKLSVDNNIFEFLNKEVLLEAISKVKQGPRAEAALDPDYRIVMRSLIVNKFMKNLN